MGERALCFLHSHCLCPSSWAFPGPTPLLYVDSPLITFKQPSGPLMQQAASVETVCYRTKDTLFLCKQHPSSTDLFMCQVDGGDTPCLGFHWDDGATFWRWSLSTQFSYRFSTEYCAYIAGQELGTNSLTYYLHIMTTCFIGLNY